MGLLFALAIGAAVGGVARMAAPRRMPRRMDVAIILAAVGAALAVAARAITARDWGAMKGFSPGIAVAATAGAVAILLAFDLLPRFAPSLTTALPGRDEQPAR